MKIIVGLSNHHVHVTKEVCDILFGNNHELTNKRDLKQLGQFACEECADVVINGYTLEHVRLIGPIRKYTQVELLESDCVNANVNKVYSDSGKLEGTLPYKLIGPCGEYEANEGAFIANNHIHFSAEDLKTFNVNNGDIVSIKTKDGIILDNIKCKSDETCVLEFHLNKDEGEKLNINTFDEVSICSK